MNILGDGIGQMLSILFVQMFNKENSLIKRFLLFIVYYLLVFGLYTIILFLGINYIIIKNYILGIGLLLICLLLIIMLLAPIFHSHS